MIALLPDMTVSATHSNHGNYYVGVDWAKGNDYTTTRVCYGADGTDAVLYRYNSSGEDESVTRSSVDIVEFHQEEPGYSAITVEILEFPKPAPQPPQANRVMRPPAGQEIIVPRRCRPRPRRSNIGVRNWKAMQ